MNEAPQEVAAKRRYSKRDYRERFWEKVIKRTDNECWLWTGATVHNGYGYFSINGRPRLAHRISWMIANGAAAPEEMKVLHSCDVRSCVNPDHLRLGTQADNLHDMDRKGRRINAPQKGSKNGWAKMTERAVISIRQSYDSGGITIGELGRRHGVSRQNIWRIIHRKTWAHV